jgi:hypothetical protein
MASKQIERRTIQQCALDTGHKQGIQHIMLPQSSENLRDTIKSAPIRDVSTHSIVVMPGARSRVTVTFGEGYSCRNTANNSLNSSKDISPVAFKSKSTAGKTSMLGLKYRNSDAKKLGFYEASIKEEVSVSHNPKSIGNSQSDISILSHPDEDSPTDEKVSMLKAKDIMTVSKLDQKNKKIPENSSLKHINELNNSSNNHNVPKKSTGLIDNRDQTQIFKGSQTMRVSKAIKDLHAEQSVCSSQKSKYIRKQNKNDNNSICFGDDRSYVEFYTKLKGKVSKSKRDTGNILSNLSRQQKVVNTLGGQSVARAPTNNKAQAVLRRQSTTGGNHQLFIHAPAIQGINNKVQNDIQPGESIGIQLMALQEVEYGRFGSRATQHDLINSTQKPNIAEIGASSNTAFKKTRKLTSNLVVDSSKKEPKDKHIFHATNLEPIVSDSPVISKRKSSFNDEEGGDDQDLKVNNLFFLKPATSPALVQNSFTVAATLKGYANPSNFTFQKESEKVDTSKADVTVGPEGSVAIKAGKQEGRDSIYSGSMSPKMVEAEHSRSPNRSLSLIGRLTHSRHGVNSNMSHMDKRIMARANRLAKEELMDKKPSLDFSQSEKVEVVAKTKNDKVPVICTGGKNTES